jgi:hypothetical protein
MELIGLKVPGRKAWLVQCEELVQAPKVRIQECAFFRELDQFLQMVVGPVDKVLDTAEDGRLRTCKLG